MSFISHTHKLNFVVFEKEINEIIKNKKIKTIINLLCEFSLC